MSLYRSLVGFISAIVCEAIRALKSVIACSFMVAPAGQNRSLITLEARQRSFTHVRLSAL